ncbi:MAG: DUF3618 domain-containing protein [Verrucomicrobiota bacterium JB022]|nr:DUF3618 domain-containing protein [Verrucomicrobiota bacterium JB022]
MGSVQNQDRDVVDPVAREQALIRQRQQLDGERSSDEWAEEIRLTRARMDATLDQLADRLHPREWVHEAQTWISEIKPDEVMNVVQNGANATGNFVRRHPFACGLIASGVALAAIGAGKLHQSEEDTMNSDHHLRRDPEAPSNRENLRAAALNPDELQTDPAMQQHQPTQIHGGGSLPLRDTPPSATTMPSHSSPSAASRASDRAHGYAGRARQGMSRAKQRARAQGHQVKERVSASYHDGRQRLQATTESHPLAVAAGFAVAGLLLGLALPRSRQERQVLGTYGQRIRDNTRAQAEDLVQRGKHAVSSAMETARHEAKNEGLTPQQLREKAEHVADHTREDLKKEGLTPEELTARARRVAEKSSEAAEAEAKHPHKQPTEVH